MVTRIPESRGGIRTIVGPRLVATVRKVTCSTTNRDVEDQIVVLIKWSPVPTALPNVVISGIVPPTTFPHGLFTKVDLKHAIFFVIDVSVQPFFAPNQPEDMEIFREVS